MKKKKKREVPKRPMVGERRALRRRIVLSNTNALEVHGMRELSVDNMADPSHIGRMLRLDSGDLLDRLRHVRAFKTTQNWNMFRRPAVLVRKEFVEMGQTILDIKTSNSNGVAAGRPRTVRRIVTGEGGTGKSLMLLHAMSMAFLNDWIVIHVPEAQEYTIGHSAYGPMKSSFSESHSVHDTTADTPPPQKESSEHIIYDQPRLTAELLERATKANEKLLKAQRLPSGYTLEGRQLRNLHDLAQLGCQESHLSWSVWQAFWKELSAPSETRRPPVLLTFDGIDHWMTLSKYRSAEYNLIHALQLGPIRHFVDILFNKNGAGQLAGGGAILAARTGSNVPTVPTFNLLLRQLEAQEQGLKMGDDDFPLPEPYKRVDSRILDLFLNSSGLHVQRLKGLEKHVEARGLLSYFARSGLFRDVVNDTTVAEKWSLAGGGVVGELARFGKRLRVEN